MQRTSRLLRVPALALVALAISGPAHAQWPNLPTVNLPVCTAVNEQSSPQAVSDGAGGSLIVWQDLRNGTDYDLYAQHVLAGGFIDPAWPAQGRAICTATHDQRNPRISPEPGGAFVVWEDYRNGTGATNPDIYATHLSSHGTIESGWPADGAAICTNGADQRLPTIAVCGLMAVWIAWQDSRANGEEIYAHVMSWTSPDPRIPVDGLPVCTAADVQGNVSIAWDGDFGAFLVWQDFRSHTNWDVYAQHVMLDPAAGYFPKVDPAWPVDGIGVCTAAGNQTLPVIVPDQPGYASMAWEDDRLGSKDIFANRLVVNTPFYFYANGLALCTAAGEQSRPTIVATVPSGSIVAWQDARSGAFAYDIYAQRIEGYYIPALGWPANGVAVCTASGQQTAPVLVSDGAGGAIIAWQDRRVPLQWGVYAQHLTVSAAVDARWPAGGRAVSTPPLEKAQPTIVEDGAGGAVLAWKDLRIDVYDYYADIYTQRVFYDGMLGDPAPEITMLLDVPADQGGWVFLYWLASSHENDPDPGSAVVSYTVWRQVSVAPGLAGESHAGLLTTRDGARNLTWEVVVSVGSGDPDYALAVPTTADSTSGPAPYTNFMVSAEASGKNWYSKPAAGYSIDNLPPASPTSFTAAYSGGATHLHWSASSDADFWHYLVYRGASAGFVPSQANLIATRSDTGYVDTVAAGAYYKLVVVDVHANQSPVVTLSPGATAGVGGGDATAFALAGVTPNPSHGRRLSVAFVLPDAAPATLELLDVSGRRIASRDVGALGSGRHTLDLELAGRAAPGLYLVRIRRGSESRVARVSVIE